MPIAGRRYDCSVCVVSTKNYLDAGSVAALRTAMEVANDRLLDVAVDASDEPYVTVRLTATVRAADPVSALGRLSDVVDTALTRVGLVEFFDLTGKSMAVEPHDRANRPKL